MRLLVVRWSSTFKIVCDGAVAAAAWRGLSGRQGDPQHEQCEGERAPKHEQCEGEHSGGENTDHGKSFLPDPPLGVVTCSSGSPVFFQHGLDPALDRPGAAQRSCYAITVIDSVFGRARTGTYACPTRSS